MYVRKLDIPWEQSSFVFQGINIQSEDDILDVQRQCTYVWVDYKEDDSSSLDEAARARGTNETKGIKEPDTKERGAKGTNEPDAKECDSIELDTPVTVEVSLEELNAKYIQVRKLHEQTNQTVLRVFDSVASKQAINLSDVQRVVSNSVDSILESTDASIWFTRLNELDDQLAQHSMNVATLSILLGQALGFSREGMEELGVCALMHDIGLTLLPSNILHATEKQKSHEDVLRSHVNIGYNIVSESKHFSFATAKAVLHHHERIDGKGYPHGLSGNDIPRNARLVAIANAYDHLISGDQIQTPCTQGEAISALYNDRGTQFDENLVIKFIEVIGLYPPGTIVEMSNGEIGVVLSSTLKKIKPRVLLVLDKNKNVITQRVVDLSLISEDENEVDKLYQIQASLPDGAFGVFLRDVERAGITLV